VQPKTRKRGKLRDATIWHHARGLSCQQIDRWYTPRLRGPGRLALLPLVRARVDGSEALVIVHVGRGLYGHYGIVHWHGGLLAILLDETLARTVSTFFVITCSDRSCRSGFSEPS